MVQIKRHLFPTVRRKEKWGIRDIQEKRPNPYAKDISQQLKGIQGKTATKITMQAQCSLQRYVKTKKAHRTIQNFVYSSRHSKRNK
jgi:hypothetical protein